jgi:hypothetical protein
MSTPSIYRRAVRRETHSSRAGAAIALAVLLILVFAWIGTEAVLSALGRPALLVSPKDAAISVLGAASAPVGLLTAGGAVAFVLGVILLIVALVPGRRGRRGGSIDRTATVVDDRVIAQSIARTGASAGDIGLEQVKVTVGKRRIDVDVTRTSGRDLDARIIREAVDGELSSYDYRPALRARVRLSKKGTVA